MKLETYIKILTVFTMIGLLATVWYIWSVDALLTATKIGMTYGLVLCLMATIIPLLFIKKNKK